MASESCTTIIDFLLSEGIQHVLLALAAAVAAYAGVRNGIKRASEKRIIKRRLRPNRAVPQDQFPKEQND